MSDDHACPDYTDEPDTWVDDWERADCAHDRWVDEQSGVW